MCSFQFEITISVLLSSFEYLFYGFTGIIINIVRLFNNNCLCLLSFKYFYDTIIANMLHSINSRSGGGGTHDA